MVTIRESVSRVKGLFKAATEDAFVTDRFVYSVILKYAKALIRRQDNESKLMKYDGLFEVLPYVELIEVDKIEADCAGLKTGCIIMRTKKKIPAVFHGAEGHIFRLVAPIDGSSQVQQTTPISYMAMSKSTNFKYNTSKYFWLKNGYLYLPAVMWEAIMVEAMFEGALDGFCGLDDCTIMQDREFKIPDYLFAEIEQMVIQETMTLGKIPADSLDDSQNILR